MININKVSVDFQGHKVLSDINMHIADHEIVVIIGTSGCGKTTLLKAVSGVIKDYEGSITGLDKNNISYVFQDDRLLPWRSVWDNIKLVKDGDNAEEIQSFIDMVGLKGFENYYPAQLSGGMKKRCGIARAFYKKSNILFMDEPFQGLDYFLRMDMQRVLLDVWKEHRQSILFITHEIDEALMLADRIILLGGRPSMINKVYNVDIPRKCRLYNDDIAAIRKQIIIDLEQCRKELQAI